ncbi:hypothetical protein ADUPG1_004332, partial [Aduncisulcus paluster]
LIFASSKNDCEHIASVIAEWRKIHVQEYRKWRQQLEQLVAEEEKKRRMAKLEKKEREKEEKEKQEKEKKKEEEEEEKREDKKEGNTEQIIDIEEELFQ